MFVQFDCGAVGQIVQQRVLATCRDHTLSSRRDRALIEIVVAKHKVDRDGECLRDAMELKDDVVTLGDISGDDDAIGPERGDRVSPSFPCLQGNMIQMGIGCPNQTHDLRPL